MMTTMTAIRVHAIGGPEQLVPERVPIPEPGPGEVLIEVRAAGLNPPDWYARAGFPQIPESLRPPLSLPFTPGSDVSGVVARLGPDATGFAVGDEVFGLIRFPRRGIGGQGYAEYTTAPVAHLARKPAAWSHVEAAGAPMAGLTAYQRLFDDVRLEPGRTVLVNGAAGGIGHFAVQFAKDRDAYVIGVASSGHEAFLRVLGVDRFIDYTTTAAEEVVRDVDLVVDTVGGPRGHRFLPVLRRGGVLAPMFLGDYHPERAAELGIELRLSQVHSSGPQMAEMAALADAGRLRVGIDSVFALADAAKAHARAERGHLRGKVVLEV
jgi:NADPH:quinone reductase-like Zn-dependent oxidoreductase